MPGRIRRCALVLSVSSVALVCGELAYRWLRTGKLGPTTNPRYVVHDERLGWAYSPGALARHETPEFDVAIRINEHGFRDKAWMSGSDERPLLLILGDSFAFGWGVEQEEGVSAQLATGLPGWRVRNAAVSGYGTDQQLLLLQALVELERPDAVMVLFCPNDLDEISLGSAYGRRKPWFEWQAGKLELQGVPVRRPWYEGYSHLAGALDKLVADRIAGSRPTKRAEQWDLAKALLGQMQGLVAPATLLLISGTEELATFAQRPDIEHFDQRTALQPLGAAATYPEDGHWTAVAHKAVAERLIPLVQRLR